MGLVDHDEIEGDGPNIAPHRAGEIQRRDDDPIGLKGLGVACRLFLPISASVEDDRRQVEFFFEFEAPLLAEARRADDEQPSFSFGPILAEHQAGLDGLAQADLIGEQNALRQGTSQGEGSGVDLMRVQVHAGIEQRHRQTICPARCMLAGELVGEVFGVVRSAHWDADSLVAQLRRVRAIAQIYQRL